MPLSKARNRERMRRVRALKREGGTVLLPASTVRRLRNQGLNITRALAALPVTLDDYWGLKRQLEAKAKRVEWQSGGIKMLREQVATLEARLATLPAMEDTALKAALAQALGRITLLEAEMAMAQAEHVVQEAPRGYGDYLLEEEGVVEDDLGLYVQHPTERTLREAR